MVTSASRLVSPQRAGGRLGATLLFLAASLWALAPLARGVGESGVGGRLVAQLGDGDHLAADQVHVVPQMGHLPHPPDTHEADPHLSIRHGHAPFASGGC